MDPCYGLQHADVEENLPGHKMKTIIYRILTLMILKQRNQEDNHTAEFDTQTLLKLCVLPQSTKY